MRRVPLLLCVLFPWCSAWARPPTLYSQPALQSPTRAEPDRLLLLPGYGFSADDRVIYEALADTARPLSPPAAVPSHSDAIAGVAPVASAVGSPYSLTVRLPSQLRADQSYALWVVTTSGEWSGGIRVNDARPLWFTPSYVLARGKVAGLPRVLKVVGRNLDPTAGGSTKIRLVGTTSWTLPADPAAASATSGISFLSRYEAVAALPVALPPGRYRVELSRDGISWIQVPGQTLTVRPEPVPDTQYLVDDPRFGNCRANDGLDDTRCILRAVAAAASAGGGTVRFSAGTWNLLDGSQPGVAPWQGIVLPVGVSLTAESRGSARIVRQAAWQRGTPKPAFTLLGRNTVNGLVFHDEAVDTAHSGNTAPGFLQLGAPAQLAYAPGSIVPRTADDLVISGDTFDRTRIGIEDGGVPLHRLFIIYNTIAAYENGVFLIGNLFELQHRFRIDDSVIAHNYFQPAGYLDVAHSNGAVATQLGAEYRVDFSDNVADGASRKYLRAPDESPGWRAAFFWHLQDNHEFVLISANRISCSGDVIGDGEAIGLDNNANTFAFSTVPTVLRASSDGVTVQGPLVSRQNGQGDLPADYYVGHWLQLADGPGIGQARRIIAYSENRATGEISLRVSPRWDVTPVPGQTRILVGREFWQVYILGNTIEHRSPPCLNSNRSEHTGGSIKVWGQTADSVIGGNRQSGADGIWLHDNFNPSEHPCADCGAQAFLHTFTQIVGNHIEGAYGEGPSCGISGIGVDVAAAPWQDDRPPTVVYGVSIEDNVVVNANDPQAGAITVPLAWYPGPPPHRWPLSDSLIIQGNQISVRLPVQCPGALQTAGVGYPSDPLVWHSIQYANSCRDTRGGTVGRPVSGATVCGNPRNSDSCECPKP